MEQIEVIQVKYRKKHLEECYRTKKEAVKKWGSAVAENYIKRLNLLYAANSVRDLYFFPQLDFHPLKGDKAGLHSVRITDRARLLLTIENQDTIIIENVSTRHYE